MTVQRRSLSTPESSGQSLSRRNRPDMDSKYEILPPVKLRKISRLNDVISTCYVDNNEFRLNKTKSMEISGRQAKMHAMARAFRKICGHRPGDHPEELLDSSPINSWDAPFLTLRRYLVPILSIWMERIDSLLSTGIEELWTKLLSGLIISFSLCFNGQSIELFQNKDPWLRMLNRTPR